MQNGFVGTNGNNVCDDFAARAWWLSRYIYESIGVVGNPKLSHHAGIGLTHAFPRNLSDFAVFKQKVGGPLESRHNGLTRVNPASAPIRRIVNVTGLMPYPCPMCDRFCAR
jgi:hypothetical protein